MAIVALAALLLILEGRVLLLLLAGALFALALRAVTEAIASRTHWPYPAVLAGICVLLVAGLGAGLYGLGASFFAQAEALSKQVPDAWHSVLDALRRRPALEQVVGPLQASTGTLKEHATAVVAGAGQAFELMAAGIVIFFLGVYGAAQPEAYPRVVVLLVPPAHRARARSILAQIGKELTRWLAGRLVAMIVVGALVTVGLLLMKISLAWALGALAGLFTFIEYLGAFASAGPAMLIAFTRGPTYPIWVAILFTGVHILEGYVLTPLLVRSTVRFPPGYTLAAQVVLGSIFGVAGLTFATPVMVIGTVLVRRLYVERHTPSLASEADAREARRQGDSPAHARPSRS
ncbi:MAG TPA: AI-2E family transporter [Polyangiaceae bacterium]